MCSPETFGEALLLPFSSEVAEAIANNVDIESNREANEQVTGQIPPALV
jgi:hypothetical protein